MRLIDADAEVKKREKLCEEKNCEYLKFRYQAMCKGCPIYEEIEAFDSAEKVEAEPVRHGRWMFHEQKNGYLWKCSNCKGNFDQQFSYCPHCGAQMGGGAGNG